MGHYCWEFPFLKGFWQAAKFLGHEFVLHHPRSAVPHATCFRWRPFSRALGERRLEQKVNEKLARWYWCGVPGELYGGAVETRFALDLQGVVEWMDGSETEPATVRDASFQPARLETLRTRCSAA